MDFLHILKRKYIQQYKCSWNNINYKTFFFKNNSPNREYLNFNNLIPVIKLLI